MTGRWPVTRLWHLLPLVALAGLATVQPAGRRWLPVFAFLTLSVVVAIHLELAALLLLRRARIQRQAAIPIGIRLRKPLWMYAHHLLSPLLPTATVAAIVAALGFPRVGLAILMAVLALAALMEVNELGLSPRALALEPGGLRVFIRGATILIGWRDITAIDRDGPEAHCPTSIRIASIDAIVATVTPDSPKARRRAWWVLYDGGSDGRVLLAPWAAGVDGVTLARAIVAGRDAHRDGDG